MSLFNLLKTILFLNDIKMTVDILICYKQILSRNKVQFYLFIPCFLKNLKVVISIA